MTTLSSTFRYPRPSSGGLIRNQLDNLMARLKFLRTVVKQLDQHCLATTCSHLQFQTSAVHPTNTRAQDLSQRLKKLAHRTIQASSTQARWITTTLRWPSCPPCLHRPTKSKELPRLKSWCATTSAGQLSQSERVTSPPCLTRSARQGTDLKSTRAK